VKLRTFCIPVFLVSEINKACAKRHYDGLFNRQQQGGG
jgi:hypothetical protein